MIWIGAALGLRWSEVAGLRVGRLDLSAGRLSVAEAIVRGIGGRNVFSPPKSKAGVRTMYMPEAIVDMLTAHLHRVGPDAGDADALVFTDEQGGPLRYSNWRRRGGWMQGSRFSRPTTVERHDARRQRGRREDRASAARPCRSEDDVGYLCQRSGVNR